MENLQLQFQSDGYVVVHSFALKEVINKLNLVFQTKFQSRFGSDLLTNRNLIKRFAESIELAALFASSEIVELVRALGVMSPVYCGPVVSHYTHSDLTGNSYGLPWHQDFPSMASSSNALIVWISVNVCNTNTHSIEVATGQHSKGLLLGEQQDNGYVLTNQNFTDSRVLDMKVGDVLLFSPFLPHRTFVNPSSNDYKLSFSRRFDDLLCPRWPEKKFANAFGVSVDRKLYSNNITS